MSYELEFKHSALKEWKKLAAPIRDQFKLKLRARLEQPHVPASRLAGMPGCYKIKLRVSGYRLVYQVEDLRVTVVVVAVGRRDRRAVYKAAGRRLE